MNLFEKPPVKTHFIDSLQSGDKGTWYYRVQEIVKKKTKNGDDFLDVTVMDKTGRMPAKIWNNVNEYYKLLQAGEIYKISGEIKDYKGKKQLTVSHLHAAAAADFNPADYIDTPPFDSAAMLRAAGKSAILFFKFKKMVRLMTTWPSRPPSNVVSRAG
jgi:DNA polymerase III alpha subunit